MEIGVFLLKCKRIVKVISNRYLDIDNVVFFLPTFLFFYFSSSFPRNFSFFFVNHNFHFFSILLSFYLLYLFCIFSNIYFFHMHTYICMLSGIYTYLSILRIYRYVIHTVTTENIRGTMSFRFHVAYLLCNQWVGNVVGSNQLKRTA